VGLFAPWFLAGLLAVGLPIYLHLLQQHKIDPLRFPSLQFFERRTETSVRQRRLKYRLLFALRALLLILLALLFANPFVRRDAVAAAESKLVLYVIDNSFSMRAAGAIDRMKQQAQSEIGSLRAGDLGQVLSISSSASLLTQPTSDKAELRAAVAALGPSDSRSSFAELARAVRAISEARQLPLEVHLFSDLQRSSMPSSFNELALPVGTTLVTHAAATASQPNYSVESVTAPSAIADPKRVRVTATVAAHGAPEASRTVTLSANGKVLASKTAVIPANGRATVEFQGFDVSYGWNRGEVKIDGGDALPQDDVFRFAAERGDPRRVLLIHEPGRTRSALYVQAALESAAENFLTLDARGVDQLAGINPASYALVILSDVGSLPGGFEESLAKWVESGGGVLAAAGAMTAAKGSIPVAGMRAAETRYASRSAERFFAPAQLDLAHPAVAKANRWEGLRLYQTVMVEPPPGATIAARVSDGSPLLVDVKRGEGRILVFASGLDNISNDFPLHTSFVPFIEQTCRYLARIESRPATLAVDSFLELRTLGSKAASAVEVFDPRGQRALDLKAGAAAETLRVTEEGYFEIARQGGKRELVAVNADRAESLLEPAPAESLDLWKKTGEAVPAGPSGVVEDGKRPVSLWWWVALALLAVTLAEAFAASRHDRLETAR
jgi:hypothetical protein